MPDLDALQHDGKQNLVHAFHIFAHLGFDLGVAGHITFRDPINKHAFWVNPVDMYFGSIQVSDLILVDHSGNILEGSREINKSAFIIHSNIHHARPDVNAVAHAHTSYGTAFAALNERLRPVSQGASLFFEDHCLFDQYEGPVLAEQEGLAIAAALEDMRAAILRNHGLLTVGSTLAEAVWWFVAMDRACQTELLIRSSGTEPVLVPEDIARKTREINGGPASAQLAFNAMVDMVRPC